VQPPLTIGQTAPACTAGSGPENAIDGAWTNIFTDKWCVPRGRPKLDITLPPSTYGWTVSKIVIKHAGVAESPALNTRAYTLFMSQRLRLVNALGVVVETTSFPIVANVTANTANETTHLVSRPNVNMVRVDVDVPTQGTNPATRIFEVQVWAEPSTTAPRTLPI
jgi:hypothetical protein